MMRLSALASIAVALPSLAQGLPDIATVTVDAPQYEALEAGRRATQDISLANTLASYTLRTDIIELADEPGKVGSAKWAYTLGYVPLGLAGPSMANWYNQGFLIWTFDGKGIHDVPATFRVIHESGPDAMVEYVWDTPSVRATVRFALTAGSDKLLLFGSYEPKTEIAESKLRLMCYPSTFEEPWSRRTVTAAQVMTEGSRALDLGAERWVVFEDVEENRPGDGSAGLLLGDARAFSEVRVDAGGYASYADLTLAPGRRSFALGLYEFPDIPDPATTRAYFARIGDDESEALAQLASADLDEPLAPMPSDPERMATIAERDAGKLARPAEAWRPSDEPLDFDWAARLPGDAVRVVLLCGRWTAFETMELARRLAMDVEHLYFDTKSSLSAAENWPYRNQTGIGPLGLGLAERHGVQICAAADREVIMVAGVDSSAIPRRVREVIVGQVAAGKGLFLAGDSGQLGAWPEELLADRDDGLVEPIVNSMPWDDIPGLRPGERGRTTEGAPYEGYHYGEGRVIVFRSRMGTYSSLVPLSDAVDGLDGAMDRVLAMHAKALLAAAGRDLPAAVSLSTTGGVPQAGEPVDLAVTTNAPDSATVVVRVQDALDRTVAALTAEGGRPVTLPAMAAGTTHFVDVLLRNGNGECLGFAGIATEPEGLATIESVALSPGRRSHPAAPTVVDLVEGGTLRCEATVAGGATGMAVRGVVADCFGRVLADAEAPVDGGRATLEMPIAPPVTVAHHLDLTLTEAGRPLAVRRAAFTVPLPYPTDDFTMLMWTYAGGEPSVRRTDRLCYELGAEMSDLCHVGGYADEAAAREYAVSAQSGMRMVPYVTRLAGDSADGMRSPCLHDADYLSRTRASIANTCTQAAPYAPAAYTLGDENYLAHGTGPEVCRSPETLTAFREWLRDRYGSIAALNASWAREYGDFAEITQIMTINEAREQTESFAPWLDHRLFMDTAFAEAHGSFAETIREVDPGAKVGWDGLLGYHWQAGYDFHKLSRSLDLNQVYTTGWPQDEFVRSFAGDDAITGQWGNAIADNEDGFSAMPWHNAFSGHNSAWWWTSWGCDYIPFNPDHSVSAFGRWHFDAAREITAGPGKLLVNAERDNSGIAVLYNQADMFAAKLAEPDSGDRAWLEDQMGLLRMIQDAGYQFQYVAAQEIEERGAEALEGYRVLFLPLAQCLSDQQVAAILGFADSGGTVVADEMPARFTGSGCTRDDRPLDALLETERGVLLDERFREYNGIRATDEWAQYVAAFAAACLPAGLQPYCELATADGPARCVEQVMFGRGDTRYLCLEQDILVRNIEPQAARLTLPEPQVVYDVREGERVGEGPVRSWEVELSRGKPLMYALMPYEVRGVSARVPAEAKAGAPTPVAVRVETEGGEAQYHVVRMDVLAPGEETPHRQYSRNIGCEAGEGRATIPFALNDPAGEWRLVFTDAATGVETEKRVELGE